MAFVRVLTVMLKDKQMGGRVVPIIPDEARTFGMEGLFRQVGIYSNSGQKYVPQDKDQVAYYREDKKGQVLQEGINELGAMSSFVAAGTSIRRMLEDQENVFFYLTVMNENYVQPEMPKGCEEGILKGIYLLDKVGTAKSKKKVKLLGCGTILEQVRAAAELLHEKFGVASEVYSVTSFNELGREVMDCDRTNMRNPKAKPKVPYITELLSEGFDGPTIAATDYIKAYAEQVRSHVPGDYRVLGTDGFGRSDSRANLRRHFEVDANHVAYASLYELYKQGSVSEKDLIAAHKTLEIDSDKINPLYA